VPFTGKHYCKKCYNYEKGYCDFKEQKLEFDYYQNCIGYFEKSIINMDLQKLKQISSQKRIQARMTFDMKIK
jgi:hypothetical protein